MGDFPLKINLSSYFPILKDYLFFWFHSWSLNKNFSPEALKYFFLSLLKWFRDLNITLATIKLLKENIGKTFYDINCSSVFLDQSLKSKKIKVKVNKRDLLKPQSFCIAKETINEMKRQLTECEKKTLQMIQPTRA